MDASTEKWEIFLLGGSGRVVSRGHQDAVGWLEAARKFAESEGAPMSVTGAVCSVRSDGSFLVYEPSGTRGFYVRPSTKRSSDPSQPSGELRAMGSTLVGMGAHGRGPSSPSGRSSRSSSELAQKTAGETRPAKDERADRKPPAKDEPPVIVDETLLAEMARLESLASVQTGQAGQPTDMLPHKLMRCEEEGASEGGSALRCALVVWPDPPRDSLRRLIGFHLEKFRNRLESQGRKQRLVVAAFDHAFHRVAMEPPLAAGVWDLAGNEEPKILFGEEAAAHWPSTGGVGRAKKPGESGRVFVPAIRLDPDGRPTLARAGKENSKSATATGPSRRAEGAGSRRREQAPFWSAPSGRSDDEPAPAAEKKGETTRKRHDTDSLLFMAFDALKPIYEARTRKEALTVVLEAVARLVPAKATALFVYDLDRKRLRLARMARNGEPTKEDDMPPVEVALGGGLVGTCARQGVALGMVQAQRDVRFGSGLAATLGFNPVSLLAAPVQHDGRLWGAIEVVDGLAREGFSGGEVEAVGYAGRLLGECLSHLHTA
jgi:hypothetical protein